MLLTKDRVKELVSSTGTTTLSLSGAESGFQAFSVLGNNTSCNYTIVDVNSTAWEVGRGVYNSNTLTRDEVFESSTGGSKISLSATGSTVFLTYPGLKAAYNDVGVNRDYTASGSITAGKPLILNADNTVTQVAIVSGTQNFTFSKGSATALVPANTNRPITSCFDISAQRFILVYINEDASNYLYGNIVEVDSSNVVTSRGIDTIISSSNGGQQPSITYDSANEKSMLVYMRGAFSSDLGCKVLTATGTSLSVGAEVVINDNDSTGSQPKVVYEPTSGKLVVSYTDQSNSSYITAQVGTISGTTSSWSSNTLISAAGTATQIGLGAGNGKVLFLTTDDSNNADARAGTISGTTLTLGSPVEFDADNASSPYPSSDNIVCYDTINDRFFAGYKGTGDNLYGMVFQISGTTVSHGTRSAILLKGQDFSVPHSSDIGKIPLIFGRSHSASPANGLFYREATITASNNSIAYNTDVTLNTTNTDATTLAYDSTNVRLLSAYHLSDDNIEAYGIVPNGSRIGSATNLTTDNYFGVASSTASTTEPVGVNRAGSFNNDQSGMTAGVDQYVTDAGLIKERATTTVTPDTVLTNTTQTLTNPNYSPNAPDISYDSVSDRYIKTYRGASDYPEYRIGTYNSSTLAVDWGTAIVITSYPCRGYNFFNAINSSGVVGTVCTTQSGGSDYVRFFTTTINPSTNTLVDTGNFAIVVSSSTFSYYPQGVVWDAGSSRFVITWTTIQSTPAYTIYANCFEVASNSSAEPIWSSSNQVTVDNTSGNDYGLTQNFSLIYDPDAQRTVHFFWTVDGSSNVRYGGRVLSISSSTITVGAKTTTGVAQKNSSSNNFITTYDTQNNKIICAFQENVGTYPKLYYQFVTVTGGSTNTISFSTGSQLTTFATSKYNIAFDTVNNKVVLLCDNGDESYYIYSNIYSSNGTSLTLDSSTLVSSTNNTGSAMDMGVEFVSGRGFVYNYVKDGVNWTMVNFASYFGSTTSSVVNGKQFVGTARSGTDLELSEPPTELVAMANGSITKGKPVNLRTDGDFEQVKETETTTSTTETIGTEIQLSNGESGEFETAHNNNGTFLVVYRFQTTGRMHARLGTYSSSGVITWGTDLTLTKPAGQQQATACYYDSDNDCFVVIGGTGLNEYIYATILTYSGVTLTEGNFVEFEAQDQNNNGVSDMSASYDTTNKIGYVVVGGYGDSITKLTVSGTSITASAFQYVFGSYTGSRMQYASLDYDIPNNTGVIYFRDSSNSYYPTVLAFTSASGTLTFGTKVALVSVQYGKQGSVAHNSTHTFVAYGNSADLTKVYYNNLSVSGTSITVGTQAVLITSANIGNKSSKPFIYNPDGKFYYVFSQTSSPYNLSLVEATASGTSLSGSFKFQQSKSSLYEKWTIGNTSISNGTMILAGYDSGNTDAKAITFTPTATITTITNNLSSNNFIGFAQDTVADNEDVKVKTVSQSDENQTGLTTASQYYVQVDGSLSTTAGTPSVLGGTALSSTKILIKS